MKSYLAPLAAVAVLTCAFGTTAVAATAPVVAKLETPVAKLKRPIAGQASFVCEGDTCTSLSPASGTNTVPGCRELVHAVGAVTSFGQEGKAFDADKLTRCNAAARK